MKSPMPSTPTVSETASPAEPGRAGRRTGIDAREFAPHRRGCGRPGAVGGRLGREPVARVARGQPHDHHRGADGPGLHPGPCGDHRLPGPADTCRAAGGHRAGHLRCAHPGADPQPAGGSRHPGRQLGRRLRRGHGRCVLRRQGDGRVRLLLLRRCADGRLRRLLPGIPRPLGRNADQTHPGGHRLWRSALRHHPGIHPAR